MADWRSATGLAARVAVAVALSFGVAHAAGAQAPGPAAATGAGQGSGLPLPRFVSLKSDRVHIRQGPGTDHKVLWIYRRAGLPLEVIQEFEGWRQVRDSEGASGWVLQSLVSGRRTALILPWEAKGGTPPQASLLADEKESARPVAIVEAGVIANIRSCNGRWCYVSVGELRGYIEQKKLWGVYANETVK